MNVELITDQLVADRYDREWTKFHRPENLAAAVASEAGELLHLFRWCPQDVYPQVDDVADEVADVVIFCLHLAESMGFDIDEAVKKKMARNRER